MIVLCAKCGARLGEAERCGCDETINNGARCDLCAENGLSVPAVADMRTPSGMWANVCEAHGYRLRSEQPLTHFEAVIATAAGMGGAEQPENIRAALEALTARPS